MTQDQARAPEDTPQLDRIIRSLEELNARHYGSMSPLARLIHRTTTLLAEPLLIGLVIIFTASWLVWNTVGARWGLVRFDPYPFQLLEFIGTIFAVLTTLLILATQRREDRLDERRSQFTLQMASLSEQKTAKIIALLEELRRDSPDLESRTDAEAAEMASPTDPSSVLNRVSDGLKDKDQPAQSSKPSAT